MTQGVFNRLEEYISMVHDYSTHKLNSKEPENYRQSVFVNANIHN